MWKIIKILCAISAIIIIPTISIGYNDEEEIDYIWLEQTINSAKETEEPEIYSKSAIVYDRTSKQILYAKNENEKLPMASTTKIMTAIILLETTDLKEEVEVVKEAAMVGGSSLKLKTGDKLTYEALLYGLMLCSGNDAAAQIAISIAGSIEKFANLMNEKAVKIGLENTNFVTPHGLDNPDHYTTAYELAKITDYALNIPKFAKVVATKTYTININGYPRTLSNTNELLGYLDGVNGVKTGFTNNAGRCLVTSAIRDDFNIITVVLGADTKKIRTRDSINLIEYTYEKYELVDLKEIIEEEYNSWQQINKKRIKIIKGKNETVGIELVGSKNTKYPIKKADKEKIEIKSVAKKLEIEAPIEQGYKLGNIEISIEGKTIINAEIQTTEQIKKKEIGTYIIEILQMCQWGRFH